MNSIFCFINLCKSFTFLDQPVLNVIIITLLFNCIDINYISTTYSQKRRQKSYYKSISSPYHDLTIQQILCICFFSRLNNTLIKKYYSCDNLIDSYIQMPLFRFLTFLSTCLRRDKLTSTLTVGITESCTTTTIS